MKRNRGLTIVAVLLTLFIGLFAYGALRAANNAAPSGYDMSNRLRAKHAMGVPVVYKAQASANNTLPATGVIAGDIVAGMINLSDATEAQESLANITVAADSVTSSGTPWAANEHYIVVVWRPQADSR